MRTEECMGPEPTEPLIVCSRCDLTKAEAEDGECEVNVPSGGPVGYYPETYTHGHLFVEAAT